MLKQKTVIALKVSVFYQSRDYVKSVTSSCDYGFKANEKKPGDGEKKRSRRAARARTYCLIEVLHTVR